MSQLGNEVSNMKNTNSERNFQGNNHKRGTICVLRKGSGIWQALRILEDNPLTWIGCFTYLGDR